MQTKPRIRNAYQKIRVGDRVVYHGSEGREVATVTSKGTNGFLEIAKSDGRTGRILGCDIDGVLKPEAK